MTAIGLPPAGSSTVHSYTRTIHRTTQNKQYIEQHKNSLYPKAVIKKTCYESGNNHFVAMIRKNAG